MKFLTIFHGWFVNDKGFEVKELEAKDIEDAYTQATVLKYKRETTFKHISFKVIPIEDSDIFMPRKLTWKERITGKIYKLK